MFNSAKESYHCADNDVPPFSLLRRRIVMFVNESRIQMQTMINNSYVFLYSSLLLSALRSQLKRTLYEDVHQRSPASFSSESRQGLSILSSPLYHLSHFSSPSQLFDASHFTLQKNNTERLTIFRMIEYDYLSKLSRRKAEERIKHVNMAHDQ